LHLLAGKSSLRDGRGLFWGRMAWFDFDRDARRAEPRRIFKESARKPVKQASR
jgi:hypothetical protein